MVLKPRYKWSVKYTKCSQSFFKLVLLHPISVLKIDRSFLSPIDTNGNNLEIIETIITLAHKLGIDITAEGVETKEQLAFLKKLKCEYGQEYFFSRPLDKLGAVALIMKNPQW
ncbi:MAG: EAL domain-containing protein [Nostoc sp.]